jgi:hypothetical protein
MEFEDYEDVNIDVEEEEISDDEPDLLEEETEEIEDDDASEIYQPKIEKKDPIIKINTKTRNVIIVPPEERITDNRLHINEASFILSTRAKEISKHGTHFLKNNITTGNAMTIAYDELYNRRCPLKLRRQVGITNKGDIIVEEWDIKTMVLPSIPPL